MVAQLNRLQPYAIALLRIAAAYAFLLHGTSKLFGMPYIQGMSGASVTSIFGIAALFEVIGGGLLLLGLFTRPAAFLLSGQMAVAYFMVHAKTAPLLPLVNHGESAVLFCFIFFLLVFTGGGALALDRLICKKS